MIHSDLHIHSEYSYDSALPLETIIKEAEARGYRVTEHDSPSDAPETHDQWRAQQEARARLPELSEATNEWDVDTRWLPLRGGDVVMFRPPATWDEHGMSRTQQPVRKCLVKSCDADLVQWRLSMTLKEV